MNEGVRDSEALERGNLLSYLRFQQLSVINHGIICWYIQGQRLARNPVMVTRRS
jgi:hypothetical protein